MASFETNVSTPELIAETIYEAATDTSSRFRYLSGADAHFLMDLRSKASEEEFMAGITQSSSAERNHQLPLFGAGGFR